MNRILIRKHYFPLPGTTFFYIALPAAYPESTPVTGYKNKQ